MPIAKGDAAILEKLLDDAGFGRLNLTVSSSTMTLSGPDEAGNVREKARFVPQPKQTYKGELAQKGRWVDARLSGALPVAFQKLVKSGAIGEGTPVVDEKAERLARLKASMEAKRKG